MNDLSEVPKMAEHWQGKHADKWAETAFNLAFVKFAALPCEWATVYIILHIYVNLYTLYFDVSCARYQTQTTSVMPIGFFLNTVRRNI